MFLQVFVLRECFALFTGNELSLSIQLGLWLFFTAIGGLLGSIIPDRFVKVNYFLLLVGGIWSLVAIRIMPLIFSGDRISEVSFSKAVLSLAVALFPLNFSSGMLFPIACRYFARENEAEAIGHFYMYEALGGALAGLLFTFLFSKIGRHLDIAVILSSALLLAAIFVFWRSRTAVVTAALIASMVVAFSLLHGFSPMIDDYWWGKKHPGSRHVTLLQTPYQRIDIAENDGQYTLYSNGVPAFRMVSGADVPDGYRRADLYMTLHPGKPRRILVIGDGEPGLPNRILEYPIDHLVYVMLDPSLMKSKRLVSLTGLITGNSRRFTLENTDGRLFVNRSEQKFDMVILDLPVPLTASQNRFFTFQAFDAVKKRLIPNGVLVFELPSLAHYLSEENTMLLASIRNAAVQAFGTVTILTGDSMVFIAGEATPNLTLADLSTRFVQWNIPMRIDAETVLDDPLHKKASFEAIYSSFFDDLRHEMQMAKLDSVPPNPNSDHRPIAYYLGLRRWLRQIGISGKTLNSVDKGMIKSIDSLGSHWLSLTGLIAISLFLIFGMMARTPRLRRWIGSVAISSAVLTSGWGGMVGELTIIYMFQNSFGRMHGAIGLLFGAYMFGLVAGSALANRVGWARSRYRLLFILRFAMVISSIIAVLIGRTEYPILFYLAIFLYSAVIGAEYPLAGRILRGDLGNTRTAGIVHGMDHLGAGIATLFAGGLILPFIGPRFLLLGVGVINFLVLIVLIAVFSRKERGVSEAI